MLYFGDKIRAGTWKSASVLAAWIVRLNIFIKRCTSIDAENKNIFKSGANADAGARNFEVAGGRIDERFGVGGFVRNSEAR